MFPSEDDFVIGGFTPDMQPKKDTSASNSVKLPVICRCPCCKSENVVDSSTWSDNGIIGPGYSSWKTTDARSCKDCGVIFKPVSGNGI